jgi:hypothetical protein
LASTPSLTDGKYNTNFVALAATTPFYVFMQRKGFCYVIYSNSKHIFMKKANINKLSLIAIAIGSCIFCSCVTTVLSGQTIKETRNVPSFTGVALSFSGDVYITQGGQQKVEIEADKNTMEIILTEMNGSTLVLKTKDGHWRDLGDIKVYITMPEVNELSIAGSGDMICENPIKTNEIELHISGSGSMKIQQLESHEVSAEITGSGDIYLAGSGNDDSELDVTITGSGSIKAEALPVSEADVRITGSGSATIHVLKELDTDITGSGSVLYKGNPLINANATGSGKTRSIN